ncbi:MAG: ABC transporter permease [Desulfarculaceae bacterium]|nr:ABC transporter permease [Desulfarculaceae bacterium]
MLLKRLLKNKIGLIGVIVIGLNLAVALAAPLLATHDPLAINLEMQAAPPSAEHWFGTDEYGRDIYSRVIYGSRISLYICLLSVVLATVGGVITGAAAGYFGGLLDNVIMRFMDALMSFPAILLAIAILAALGPNLYNVIIALGVVYVPRFARIVRSSVLSLKEKEFVEASRAMGNGDVYIIFRHILPNCTAPLIVQATASLAYAILAESSLGFLGLGAPPPAPSWGNILSDARNFMMENPMMTVFPGVAITLAVLGFNLLGDALRDVLDPRLK